METRTKEIKAQETTEEGKLFQVLGLSNSMGGRSE
jgi:hypothetical protein